MLNTRGHKFLVLQRNCETERKTSSAFQADTSVGVDGDRSGQTYLLPYFGSTGEKVKSRPQKITFHPVLGAPVKKSKVNPKKLPSILFWEDW